MTSLHIHGGLDKDRANVFVKYLPPEIDNEGLQSMFGVFGKIVSAKVMVDQETGLSLGYGFVRFSHPKEAKKAISTMSGHKINNKTLLCRLSNNLAFPEPSTNLYIKPLPTEMTEGELISQFNTYGTILTVKIVREKGPPYERIGFVRYENVECASKAIEDKNGTKLAPNNPPLTVKYAESEMKRALRKAHALPKHIAKMNNNNNNNNTARSSFPIVDLHLQKFANLSLNHNNNQFPNLVNLPLSSKNSNSNNNDNNLLLLNINNSNIDNNNNDNNNLNTTTIQNNTYNTTNGNNNENINNSNNKTISSPIFDSSTSSFEAPVMSVPYYVPPNEWYYNHMPAFSNEMGYPRTHTYQVLLVPVSNVPFPVYNPRSQWQMGPNFSPGNFPPTQQNL